MKKKIAILLAAVMLVSMLPVNAVAAAAATPRLSRNLYNIPTKTILYEYGFATHVWNSYGNAAASRERLAEEALKASRINTWNKFGVTTAGDTQYDWALRGTDSTIRDGINRLVRKLKSDDAIPDQDYYSSGSDIVIPFDQRDMQLNVGDTFTITLENAKWFFRANDLTVSDTAGNAYNGGFGSLVNYYDNTSGSAVTSLSAVDALAFSSFVSSNGVVASNSAFSRFVSIYDSWNQWALSVNAYPRTLLGGNTNFWKPIDQFLPYGAYVDASASKAIANKTYGASGIYGINSTYNLMNGIYYADSETRGDYYRYAADVTPANVTDYVNIEVPYVMQILDETRAQVTITGTRGLVDRAGTAITNPSYGQMLSVGQYAYNVVSGVAEPKYRGTLGGVNAQIYNTTYRSLIDTSTNFNTGLEKPVMYDIRIPLVVATTGNGDTKVTISNTTAGIFPGTFSFSNQAEGDVTVSVKDPYTARDLFPLDKIEFKETRVNSIKDSSSDDIPGSLIVLEAPRGFRFRNDFAYNSADRKFANADIKIGVETGLAWSNSTTTSSTSYLYGTLAAEHRGVLMTNGAEYDSKTYIPTSSIYGTGTVLTQNIGYRGVYFDPMHSSSNKVWGISYYYDDYNKVFDESRVVIYIDRGELIASTQVPGALYVEGLALVAEDDAPFGDIMMRVINQDDITYYNRYLPGYLTGLLTNRAAYLFGGIKTFKAGTRSEWDLGLESASTPELISGRYDRYDRKTNAAGQLVDDGGLNATEVHKTGRVTFKELSVNAWWTGRFVNFTLPESTSNQLGAKFRKVQIVEVNEFAGDGERVLKDTPYLSTKYEVSPPAGVYLNDGEKHGYVELDNNRFTINNLRSNANQRASVVMDMWVSIESGFAGGTTPVDLMLRASGTAIPTQSNGLDYVECSIAKVIDPITVEVTDPLKGIKVGLQYQSTSDIIITEAKAGMLQKDKKVRVTISDLITDDIVFTPETKVEVTANGGTFAIQNVRINEPGEATRFLSGANDTLTLANNAAGGVSFDVKGISTTGPASITLSNVGIKLNRTVPETNKYDYKVVVWGTAVAENFNTNRDAFQTPGIMTEYVKVETPATGVPGILNQEVRVPADANYYYVEGIEYPYSEASIKPYLSTASNSMMVPLRFVSYALGISEDQVIWDAAKRTATIITPSRVVLFAANSDRMVVDGVETQMLNQENKVVKSEIKNDRMYIPFRMLGNALGIPVSWDATDREAIYNPKEATNN